MTNAYKDHPLTDQEVYDLTAYLRDVTQTMIKGQVDSIQVPFLLIGIGGWCIFIFILLGLWRLRKRLSVNHEIFARQMATEK